MKKVAIVIIILIVLGGLGYNYIFRAPQNISTATSEFTVDADQFSQEFTDNLNVAEKKYLNKVITIEGTISDIENESITLNNSVYCKFDIVIQLNKNEKIKVKGKCIGYDDLFEIIKLDQCIIEN